MISVNALVRLLSHSQRSFPPVEQGVKIRKHIRQATSVDPVFAGVYGTPRTMLFGVSFCLDTMRGSVKPPERFCFVLREDLVRHGGKRSGAFWRVIWMSVEVEYAPLICRFSVLKTLATNRLPLNTKMTKMHAFLLCKPVKNPYKTHTETHTDRKKVNTESKTRIGENRTSKIRKPL